MTSSKKRGAFIVIYGINNVGKSTQAKNLVKFLKQQGKKAIFMKYPVYDLKPTGPYINHILRSGKPQGMSEEELQLWYVLNRHQFQPKLEALLEKGTTVVAEDYIGTGIGWGVAKGGKLKELEEMNRYLRKEDLAILIDGERGMLAQEEGHLHESKDELVEKCRSVFLELQEKYGWYKVDRQSRKEDTQELIREYVQKKLF
jgi:thymidylate kinase